MTKIEYKTKMKQIRNWESLQDLFKVLNENVDYLVLRNYEEFLNGEFNKDHPDIDFLCKKPEELIRYTESTTRTGNQNDFIHQKIMVKGKWIDIDIRNVGDGYYDEAWEIDMLSKRKLINNFCYVLDEENYFFSLLYHALIQKKKVSNDYKLRLEEMANNIFEETNHAPVSLEMLQCFMRERNYYFTYPKFLGAIVNIDMVDKNLIKADRTRKFRKLFFIIKKRINRLTKNSNGRKN